MGWSRVGRWREHEVGYQWLQLFRLTFFFVAALSVKAFIPDIGNIADTVLDPARSLQIPINPKLPSPIYTREVGNHYRTGWQRRNWIVLAVRLMVIDSIWRY